MEHPPETAARAEAVLTDVATRPPPAPVIACELPCVSCGYDLRTMRLEGQCPECGKACRDSLRSLAVARLDDLTRSKFGMGVVVRAAIGVPVLAALVIGTMLGIEFWGSPIPTRLGENIAKLVGFGVVMVGPAVSALGVFLLTRPVRRVDVEGEAPEVESRRLDWAARSAAIAFAVFAGCAYLFVLSLESWFWAFEWAGWAMATLLFLTACGGICRNYLLCGWMRAIALRGNAPRLARWLRVLQWVSVAMLAYVVLLAGCMLLLYKYADVLDRSGPNNSRPLIAMVMVAYAVFSMLGSFGSLGWALAWAVTLLRFDVLLQGAKRTAAARGVVIERAAPRMEGATRPV